MRVILLLAIVVGLASYARAQPVYYETQCHSVGSTLSCTVRRVERALVDPDRFAMDFGDHYDSLEAKCLKEHPDPAPPPRNNGSETRAKVAADPNYQRVMAIIKTCSPWHGGCQQAYAERDKIEEDFSIKRSDETERLHNEYIKRRDDAKRLRSECLDQAIEGDRITREREANINKEVSRQEPIVSRHDLDYRKALRTTKRCTAATPACDKAKQVVVAKRAELRSKIAAAMEARDQSKPRPAKRTDN